MDKKAGHTVKYTLNVEKAGRYTLGFIIANGTDKTDSSGKLLDGEDIIDIYVSKTAALGTKQPVSIDIKNTRNVGTGSYWFNFMFKSADDDGNAYTVNLPAGEVTLTLYLTDKINTGVTPNIDKFVIIPEGKECSLYNVFSHYDGTDVNTSIDINKDSYKGITYADVENGTATLEQLIEQMSYSELIQLCYGHTAGISNGTGSIGFTSNAIAEKYGVYSADTADGPAGLRLSAKASVATFWPCSTLQASTWNTELMERIGEAVGEECLRYNADIWLAPGLNLHRNPLCGRNFEYYSEDPVVAGKSTAAVVNGVESKGVACAIKHFAVNNKETNRKNSDSRVSQKALREIYLRSFEIAVKNSDPMCIMTSYNMLNGTHTSANSDLIRGIVRGEWGYEGLIMSDWNTIPVITREIVAGNNVTMPTGEPDELENSVRNGILSRGVLEENAKYIINTLVKLPDHKIHLNYVNDISDSGVTTLTADKFSKKSYTTKFEIVDDSLCACYTEYKDDIGESYGFVEFKVNVKTAGTYLLSLKYATTASVTNAYEIQINGETVKDIDRNVASTSDWAKFSQKRLGTVTLDKGVSTIRIQHTAPTAVNYGALVTTFVSAGEHTHSFEGEYTQVNIRQHKQVCSCGEEMLSDHTWDEGTVTLQPTYEKDGINTLTCTACQRTKTELIPKLTVDNTDVDTDTDLESGGGDVQPVQTPVYVYVIIGVCAVVTLGCVAITLTVTLKKKKK